MEGWKRILTEIVSDAEAEFDRLKYRLAYALGGPDPIKILAYRGFGTPGRLYIQGRVVEDQAIPSPRDDDSIWRNLLNTYRRLASDEVPHARLLARVEGLEQEIHADEEGQFAAWLEPGAPLAREGEWRRVGLELLGPRSARQPGPVRATAEALVPSPEARFGVISDIDDTVLKSDATSLVRMARTVFLGNARTRLPFPGAAALYRALRRGASGGAPNPLFYVSNSPWNLYDLLLEFMRLQEFPQGPVIFLRNYGITSDSLSPLDKDAQRAHKLRAIRLIMDTYPTLPFILIGDSGEQDPEIYREVSAGYRERILAVYIRNIGHDPKRPASVRELAKEVVLHGSTLLLTETSLGLAEHAAERGWIDAAALPEIGREKQEDEKEPSRLERLLGQDEPQAEGRIVSVPGRDAEETRRAIDAGAIEEALLEGDPRHERAPDVRVEPDE